MRIAVAVSGGADSLYALISLHEKALAEGHEVVAVHGLFLPTLLSAAKDTEAKDVQKALQKLCDARSIPLYILDFRTTFDKLVIQPFLEDYAAGRTPNPCALCNKQIKFGLLMDAALNPEEVGAHTLATGHYASLRKPQAGLSLPPAQSPLAKGSDVRKDQSYFLSLVPRERFSQVTFPLASTEKTQNIAYLHAKGIAIPQEKESQEICFVPGDAYRQFVLDEADKRKLALGEKGPIIVKENTQNTVLGQHLGLWQYTEGQRRGLGVAWKEPLYVCAKDMSNNALILGAKEEALLHGCTVQGVNFLVASEHWPSCVQVRVRYRQKECPAEVTVQGTQMRIEFSEPQSPTAPGQVAVVYDQEGSVLAGGLIETVF